MLQLSVPLSYDITIQLLDDADTAGSKLKIISINTFIRKNLTESNVDYVSGPYNVTFTAGQNTTKVSVLLIDDKILEDNETFYLEIKPGSLPDGVISGSHNITKLVITDDESKLLQTCMLFLLSITLIL